MILRNALLAAAAATLPTLAIAQPVAGPYVSLGAGVNLLQNQSVTDAYPYFGTPKIGYSYDPGFAGQASLGYGFGTGFRVEVEGDYAYNDVNGVRVAGLPGGSGGKNGHNQQYGGFVNALFDVDLGLPVIPYVGLGAGYQQVELTAPNYQTTFGVLTKTKTDFGNFAYQGIAGVAFSLGDFLPGLALTAEYRFIGVVPTQTGSTLANQTGTIVNPRVQLNDTLNHQVLIGLRYAFGAPAVVEQAVQTVAAPAPAPARTYLVFFDWDKAELTARARQIVAEAAQASTRVQTTRIEVNGYTDTSGTPRYNEGLSVRRAKAVQAELVRDGVPAGEISIHGYGETRLLVQTGPGVREPQNRRVEIILK